MGRSIDVVNSSGDPYEKYIYWPSVVIMAAPFVSVVAIKVCKWRARVVPPKREDDIELMDASPNETKPEETGNPIHP